jgi:hypothetical protein
MASIFDDLPTNPNQLQGTDFAFYDADTLYDGEGQGYRLQGINALETDKIGKSGEVGGDLTTEQAVKLANELGFTNVVKLGRKDSTGSREMVDLRDAQGRSFSTMAAASGLAQPMAGFDPGGMLSNAQRYRRAAKTTDDYQLDEFDKAAAILDQHLEENNAKTYHFKQMKNLPGQSAPWLAKGVSAVEVAGIDTDTGESLTPLGTAWDTAINGMIDAGYGIADMVGDRMGVEGLEKWGEAGSEAARYRIAQEGKILVDWQDVDGFGDAMSYLSNNLAMSLPYMGMSIGAALAAPVTGGASLLAPVSVYTGQVWNEMGDQLEGTDGERSATIAISAGILQTALDALGVKLVFNIGGKTAKDLFKEGVRELVSRGYSEKQAAETLATMSKREIANLSGDAATLARQQISAKNLLVSTMNRAGQGGLSEGVTEAMQETIGAISADIGSTGVIDWVDVKDRAIAGAVAGAALGGAMSSMGTMKDAAGWADALYLDAFNQEDASAAQRYAEDEINSTTKYDDKGNVVSEGYVPTNEELLSGIQNVPDGFEDLNARADREEKRRKSRSTKETLDELMTDIPALWRGAVRHIFTPDLQQKYRSARVMASIYGGHLQKIFGGATMENAKHHKMTIYKNSVMDPQNFFVEMNKGKHVTSGDKLRLSQEFYTEVQKGFVDPKNGNYNWDPDLIPESETKATTVALAKQLLALGDKLHADQKVFNKDLGRLNSYLLRYRVLDKYQVKKNRTQFIKDLKDEYGLSDADAVALTDEIIFGDSADIGEAFSVTNGGPHPDSHKARKFNMSDKDKFQKYMEQDVFANASSAARSAARYTVNQQYVGDNGSVLNKWLDQMAREGASQEEIDKVAYKMKRWLDAESGNYKRPTTEFGKTLHAIQKNFMVFATVTGLPLAVISSLPELAMTTRGLTKEQIFGVKGKREGSLSYLGKEMASMFREGIMEIARAGRSHMPVVGKEMAGNKSNYDRTRGTSLNRRLGFYEWDVGAASLTGVTDTHSWHNKFLEKYFKWTGLQGFTNMTRAVRASIAGDFILDNLNIILNHDPVSPMTNEVRLAHEKLRNLGLDTSREQHMNDIIAAITGTARPDVESVVAMQVREAYFNFVNEAVALPQSANRPLMYQDPRLSLFMQFQGYMSTVQANHLPRMYDEYLRRGNPALKYHTFSMMATMIMFGFASQYLKDMIKFGESSPYLDEAELAQRGIAASGLLGTSERVIDQLFPIYETRSDGPVEWLFNTASGESPTIGKAKQLAGAVADTVTGDFAGGGKDLARATLGPFYQPLKWHFMKED